MVKPILAVIALLVIVAAVWWLRPPSPYISPSREAHSVPASTPSNSVLTTTGAAASPHEPSHAAPLVGEKILRDYGNPALPPENDLTLLSRLMENFNLLVKTAADGPLSANEDWAGALCGRNPAHERFLPDHHVALNAKGQLVDRWGTPLFFHAIGGGRFDLRSAGPDRKLWTADDLHRNADGSFRHGADLNPPSLFQTGLKPTP